MNSSSFSIKKSILLKTLKELSRVLGRISKLNKSTVLEITITNEKLTLVIPGAKHILDCDTTNTVKATINLFYFLEVISSQKKTKIHCKFTEGKIDIEGLTLNIQTTFFETDKILRSVKMPLNYTDWHLLRLEKEGFTKEEIEFNNLNYKVYCAKRTLKLNISKTFDLLKIYGVNEKDIEEIINKKIEL
ncbi:hypothetical protein [Flavobacterium sp. GSA192]|uniref:hypothetical protein n=1 Tax=Flavobacterium sp. GSA192 TaxID=2576304 RepID=UPI001126672C|nr:hypothetical protein [Flavobacterium sp. GSA192]